MARAHHSSSGPRVLLVLALLSTVALACGDDGPSGPGTPTIHTVTVQLDGHGLGTITSSPAGIACAPDGGTCSADFAAGTTVTLTAAPSDDHTFAGWSAGCSGTGACSFAVASAVTVGARFDNPRLTATEVGTGGGEAVSSDGALTLSVPSGALEQAMEITIEKIDVAALGEEWDEVVALGGVSAVYELGPSGLAFATPATLRFASAQEPVVEDGAVSLKTELMMTLEDGQPGLLEGSATGTGPAGEGTIVLAQLGHFSPAVITELGGAMTMSVEWPASAYVGETFEVRIRLSLSVVRASGAGAGTGYEDGSGTVFGPAMAMTMIGQNEFEAVLEMQCLEAGVHHLKHEVEVRLEEGEGGVTGAMEARTYIRTQITCVEAPAVLTVHVVGDGTVTSSPNGVFCSDDGTCAAGFPVGTQVILTATPADGWLFDHWEGVGLTSEGGQRVIDLQGDSEVTAYFIVEESIIDLIVPHAAAVDNSSGRVSADDHAVPVLDGDGETIGSMTVRAAGGDTFVGDNPSRWGLGPGSSYRFDLSSVELTTGTLFEIDPNEEQFRVCGTNNPDAGAPLRAIRRTADGGVLSEEVIENFANGCHFFLGSAMLELLLSPEANWLIDAIVDFAKSRGVWEDGG